MTTVLLFACTGIVTWFLRAGFIALVPARRLPAQVTASLRYAAPAVFSALVVTALTSYQHGSTNAGWHSLLAVVVTAVATRRIPNLTVAVGVGAGCIYLLSLL